MSSGMIPILIITVVFGVSIIAISFREPFTCTMNLRYVVPLSLPMAYFLGRSAEISCLRRASALALFLFVVLEFAFYVPFLLRKLPF